MSSPKLYDWNPAFITIPSMLIDTLIDKDVMEEPKSLAEVIPSWESYSKQRMVDEGFVRKQKTEENQKKVSGNPNR